MRTLRRIIVVLLIAIPLVIVGVIAVNGLERGEISNGLELPGGELLNFHKIDEGVYRSAQPLKKDFEALELFGVEEVLNLRSYHADKKVAEGTSLTLHHLPVHAHLMNEEQLIEALKVIHNRKGPILIHCFHGSDRTGAVAALYNMVYKNMPKEEAVREMLEGGYGHHKIYINITRLVRNIDVEKVKRELGIIE